MHVNLWLNNYAQLTERPFRRLARCLGVLADPSSGPSSFTQTG